MKLRIEITGEGLSPCFGEPECQRLEPSADANQVSPRRNYVYAHYDEKGTPFYIGKGVARRAWDNSRHRLWLRYVEHHLKNKYAIRILADNLSPAQAEDLENEWIAQESETLVNWINFGRKIDYDALNKYHALRDANCDLIVATRSLEKSDPELAISRYYQAIANTWAYASLQLEPGLIGLLLDEEKQEFGYSGELQALDRLTLCLKHLGRALEARSATEEYFATYQVDQELRLAESIKKRVGKV
ncbi:hypothetical protein [Pseudomonas sp. BF-R-05]|uniref:hypothetical protein n=1 Tax=Pseudomonas sp. BF-R-05 TaxID=2832364 RepID=UPI001CBA7FED|nr:hypothetical protein [Pseudomonas sp. BF-R-05]